MSKELESAIRYVSECLEQDDNPDHCDIREILAAARQTLGRADDSEPFTLADWEALRYRRYSDGIGTESGGVIHYVAHLGRSSLNWTRLRCIVIPPSTKPERSLKSCAERSRDNANRDCCILVCRNHSSTRHIVFSTRSM